MPRKPAKPRPAPAPVPPLDGFDELVGRIAAASDALREGAMAVVNRSVTARACLTGCYIVEYEQHGLDRARYGARLLERLAERLEDRGFSLQNLKNFRRFYLLYPGLAAPVARYLETLSGKRQSLTILLRLQRPTRGLRKIFQPLEKNFPIIGKIFSNHWKKQENFFKSLENRRKIFPIGGKLAVGFALCLVFAAAPPARAWDGDGMPAPTEETGRITLEKFTAILEAELDEPEEGVHPYSRPDFDDSAWKTVVLPLAPDARPPWPKGADGTIWYRRSFPPAQELSSPRRYDEVCLNLGKIQEYLHIYVNGIRASVGLSVADGTLVYSDGKRQILPGTNTLAISASVRGGQGWIPFGAPADMNVWMCFGIFADGPEGGGFFPTDEWTIPLAGEWKCLFVPAADASTEGGAQ